MLEMLHEMQVRKTWEDEIVALFSFAEYVDIQLRYLHQI